MAHLTKKRFTKPIPDGATIVTIKGVPSARFRDGKGKTVTAPLTKDGQRVRLLSSKWYAVFSAAEGGGPPVPLFTDQTASLARLAELLRKREHGQAGIADPFELHRRRPLAEHVTEWRAALSNDGVSAKQCKRLMGCVRVICDACKFAFIDDISASTVQQCLADLRADRKSVAIDVSRELYTLEEIALLLEIKPSAVASLVRRHRHRLADQTQGSGKARRFKRSVAEILLSLRGRGASIQTSNTYLAAVKQFCGWLVSDRRTLANPLKHLSGGNVELDRRHDRRILDAEELRQVLNHRA